MRTRKNSEYKHFSRSECRLGSPLHQKVKHELIMTFVNILMEFVNILMKEKSDCEITSVTPTKHVTARETFSPHEKQLRVSINN